MGTKHTEGERRLTKEAEAVDSLLTQMNNAEQSGSRQYHGEISIMRKLYGRMPEKNYRAAIEGIKLLSYHGLPIREAYTMDSLTNGERAAIIALSLYAGAPRRSYEPNGRSFGYAFGRVSENQDNDNMESIMSRIVYDVSFPLMVNDISKVVRRLGDVKLDYAVLTNDLIWLQVPKFKERVLVRWAKDFRIAQMDCQKSRTDKKKEDDGTKD